MPDLHAIIMAGGSGTRFWPASRTARPKQVLPLANGLPLIAGTLQRLDGLCGPDHTWIVTNAMQVDAVQSALPDFPRDHIVIEPEPRDTAPCIALAAAVIAARDPDAAMVVMPADHVIAPTTEFQRMIRRGCELAADDATLVTFGIEPTYPATGFGYIECGDAIDEADPPAHRTRRFREKPDAATAQQFVERGLLWNSGIFVWTCKGLRAAMRSTSPVLADSTDELTAAIQRGESIEPAFARTPRASIDFAVMEQAPHLAVVRAKLSWNDIGGYRALADIAADVGAGNRAQLIDGASSLLLDSQNNLIYGEGRRTVCLYGVEDLVVVAVDDAVLVCPKSHADDLKRLVEHVRQQGRDDLL